MRRAIDLVAVRELAAATVGYDARRGDTLAVAAIDFHQNRAPKQDGWLMLYGALARLTPTFALVVGCALITRIALPSLTSLAKMLLTRASIEKTHASLAGAAPARVRGALEHEPPHAAAAIISALPAATAAAVLELYPQHEREAIVRRMQRANTTLIPSIDEVLVGHD